MVEKFDQILSHLDELELTTVHGRITEVIGMLIKAIVPQVKMGEVVMIKREGEPLMAEIVGFTREEVYLSPLGPMHGIGPSSEVIPMRLPLHIKVGSQLLGRVPDELVETESHDRADAAQDEERGGLWRPSPPRHGVRGDKDSGKEHGPEPERVVVHESVRPSGVPGEVVEIEVDRVVETLGWQHPHAREGGWRARRICALSSGEGFHGAFFGD